MYRTWNVAAVHAPFASPRTSRNGVRAHPDSETWTSSALPSQLLFISVSAMSRTTHAEQHAEQLWKVGPGVDDKMYRRVATAILKYRQKPPITLQQRGEPVTTEDVNKLHREIETMFEVYDRVQGVFVHDGLWRQWLDRQAAAFDFTVLHNWLQTKPRTGQLYYEVMKEFHAEAHELGESIMTFGLPASEGVRDWIALMVRSGP